MPLDGACAPEGGGDPRDADLHHGLVIGVGPVVLWARELSWERALRQASVDTSGNPQLSLPLPAGAAPAERTG